MTWTSSCPRPVAFRCASRRWQTRGPCRRIARSRSRGAEIANRCRHRECQNLRLAIQTPSPNIRYATPDVHAPTGYPNPASHLLTASTGQNPSDYACTGPLRPARLRSCRRLNDQITRRILYSFRQRTAHGPLPHRRGLFRSTPRSSRSFARCIPSPVVLGQGVQPLARPYLHDTS